MNHSVHNGNEPTVEFDYAALDAPEFEIDEQWWNMQSELLSDILRWLCMPRSLNHVGARCFTLSIYLNPAIVNKSCLSDIALMRGAPTRAALSKAMLEFQQRHNLKPSYYQKAAWMRERYRQAAKARQEIPNEFRKQFFEFRKKFSMHCQFCKKKMKLRTTAGRPSKFCSNLCRQANYDRQQKRNVTLDKALVAHEHRNGKDQPSAVSTYNP